VSKLLKYHHHPLASSAAVLAVLQTPAFIALCAHLTLILPALPSSVSHKALPLRGSLSNATSNCAA
jgi:hypothetical protein